MQSPLPRLPLRPQHFPPWPTRRRRPLPKQNVLSPRRRTTPRTKTRRMRGKSPAVPSTGKKIPQRRTPRRTPIGTPKRPGGHRAEPRRTAGRIGMPVRTNRALPMTEQRSGALKTERTPLPPRMGGEMRTRTIPLLAMSARGTKRTSASSLRTRPRRSSRGRRPRSTLPATTRTFKSASSVRPPSIREPGALITARSPSPRPRTSLAT